MWKDVIALRAVSFTRDGFGDSVASNTDTTVFANKKSVVRSEFYSANAAGIKIDTVFEVRSEDYADQTVVVIGATVYDVVRAYKKGESNVELTCAIREVK